MLTRRQPSRFLFSVGGDPSSDCMRTLHPREDQGAVGVSDGNRIIENSVLIFSTKHSLALKSLKSITEIRKESDVVVPRHEPVPWRRGLWGCAPIQVFLSGLP